MAFNSPSGGRVALDDISFSPQFCSTDSGELQPVVALFNVTFTTGIFMS